MSERFKLIAQTTSFCFSRIIKKWMLWLYLAVGPSLAQAVHAGRSSAHLVKYSLLSFEKVA